jgi:hypothetical protein
MLAQTDKPKHYVISLVNNGNVINLLDSRSTQAPLTSRASTLSFCLHHGRYQKRLSILVVQQRVTNNSHRCTLVSRIRIRVLHDELKSFNLI